MAARKPIKSTKPKINDVGGNEQRPDGGGDPLGTKSQSGGFDPLMGGLIGAGAVGGYIAGKLSGVGARVVNKVRGQTVLVHGSPISGLKKIEPRFPTTSKTEVPRVYGVRTDVPFDDSSKSIVSKYAKGTFYGPNLNPPKQGGSIYVIRTPLKTTELSAEQLRYGVIATSSTSKGRVLSEIGNVSAKTKEQISKELNKALRRSGVKLLKKR